MADIFISYASGDRGLVEKLSALLESKGYAVWFDKALEPASHYRDKIMEQIDEARVVLCVWTPTSIRSEWCRAEANRARVDGKLIPVRTSNLPHNDIPLPFGELHTILLDDEAQIERAIVKQLLAPRHMAPWYRRLWGGAKHEALTWISIIGAVLTLATGFMQALNFAPLVKSFVDNFLGLTNRFWSATLGFSPQVTLYDSVLLNLWLFFFILFISSCSRRYVSPPLLSEKYLRDHLFGAIAAFIIVYIFYLTAQQLQEDKRATSYIFDYVVALVAAHLPGGSPAAARGLIMAVMIGFPVATTLGLGYRFDPAKYATRMWRVVAGLALLNLLNLTYNAFMASGANSPK